jgi:hypothetical protein
MFNTDHIDPRNHHLVCGLKQETNEITVTETYNKHKKDRFIPYRVKDYPSPEVFGDVAEFLVRGEWVVCEFGGKEWKRECRRVGFSSTRCGLNAGTKTQENLTGLFNPQHKQKVEQEWGRKKKAVQVTTPQGEVHNFASCKEAAAFFGLLKGQLSKVCNGHISNTKGYKAQFTA